MSAYNRTRSLISPKYIKHNPYAIDNIGLCVYFISDGEFIKIGIANSVKKRLNGLQTANARKLNILYVIRVCKPSEAHAIETKLHKYFHEQNTIGEWFSITENDILRASHKFNLALGKPYYPDAS